jgi:hypothetical protein
VAASRVGAAAPVRPQDPYLMACLRSGPTEVECVTTLVLIDCGLLHVTDRTVTRSPTAEPELGRRRIEREILYHF